LKIIDFQDEEDEDSLEFADEEEEGNIKYSQFFLTFLVTDEGSPAPSKGS
jgi:hypothetical protein